MKTNYHTPNCDSCLSRDISIFCDLTDTEIGALNKVKTCNIYDKGKIIFHEGNNIHGIYCVSKGKIKLYQLGGEGKEQIIRFAKPGDVIGYRALLSEEPLSASAESLEDAIVCFIPKNHIFKMLKENQNFNFKMLKELSHELGTSVKTITDLAQKPVRERLAETLLMLKDTFELDDQKIIQVKLSREELANIVGTATESVIRLLSEYKKEGIIALEGKNIKLLDVSALTRAANIFD